VNPRRANVLGRAWSAADDAAIRAGYEKGEAPAIARQLGRTLTSVYHRAQRLGIQTHRRWTKDDDRRLRNWWGEFTVETIAKRLNRTAATTFWRATILDLPLGAPDGTEYLSHAAERTGYALASLRLILKRSGVEMKRTMSRPEKGTKRHFHCVEPLLVDAAIAAWLKTEPLEAAARARGLSSEALAKRLRGRDGVPPKPTKIHWRIPTAVIDQALAADRTAA
jgi:hypothetical protein